MGGVGSRLCACVALLGVLAAGAPAQARRAKLHVIDLSELQAYFDVLAGVDIERHQVAGVDDEPRSAEKLVLGQRLGLASAGSFVHPRFWLFRAVADVLFIEDVLRGDLAGPALGDEEAAPAYQGERFAVSPEFDVQFDFLSGHATPFSAHGQRQTQILRREFQSTTWITTWSAGGTAAWNNRVFPLAVHYDYLRGEGDARELVAGDESHQLYASGQHTAGRSQTYVEYRLLKYDNRYQPEDDYLFHFGQVNNILHLDAARDYRLDSLLWVQSRDAATVEQTEVRLKEAFIAQFLPSLRLRTQYDIAWWRWQEADFLQNLGWLELRHQLWKSLTSVGFARVAHDLGEDSDRLEGTLGASVLYRKDLGPLVMTHRYQVLGSWARTGGPAARRSVMDEEVLLEGELPARLAAAQVDPTTILVVDATRTLRYLRGRDYEVTATEGVTYVHRLTGGDIPDGAAVLVSYDYESADEPESTLLDQIYSARLETDAWTALRLYAQYTLHDVRTSGTQTERRALRYHDVATGLDVDVAGVRGNTELRYVTSEHYTAWELAAGLSYAIPVSPAFRPVIGVRELYLDIDQPPDRRNLLEVFTEGQVPLWRELSGAWAATYHWEQGGASDGHYLLGRARLQWPVRKILFWLEYAVALERRDDEHHERHNVTFNVRRLF